MGRYDHATTCPAPHLADGGGAILPAAHGAQACARDLMENTLIIQLPIPDRNPGIFPADRKCSTCGCVLSRNNPQDHCAPCELTTIGREVDNVFELRPRDAA